MADETPLILANNLSTLSASTVTAENTDDSYKLSRLWDSKRYTQWRSVDTTDQQIVWTFAAGDQRIVSAVVIEGVNLSTCTVKFAWSDTGAFAGEETDLYNASPADEAIILLQPASQIKHQYYILKFTSLTEIIKVKQLWFGEAWFMESGPVIPYDPDQERIEYQDFETESGVLIRSKLFKKRVIDISLSYFQDAMYQNIKSLFDDFDTYGGFMWFVGLPTTTPTDILFMIHKMKEQKYLSLGGTARKGKLEFEEVLGG